MKGVISIETAVFVFAGFLDSGKTTAIKDVLFKTRVAEKEKSLIVCTEEGEEEYSNKKLSKLEIDIVNVEDEEKFTEEFFEELADRYRPDSVYIEFNGMWDLKKFLKLKMPSGWYFSTIFSLVDATTYKLFLRNMRQVLMNPLSVSDIIFFNRCTKDFKKGDVSRAIKILNHNAELYFTNPNGKLERNIDNFVIKNENGVLMITDDKFCHWFVDAIENADKYYGKRIKLSAMVTSGKDLSDNQFYLGRYAIICCIDDAQFIGFVAEYDGEIPKDGEWIEVEAVISKGKIVESREIILLKIDVLRKCEVPKEIFLYF